MQYQVPQFIEIEDKIFGPLTLKQFIYLAGAGGVCLAAFTILPWYFAFFVSTPFVVFGLALAFYKVNDRPFIVAVEHAFLYFFSDKLYLWRTRPPEAVRVNPNMALSDNLAATPALTEGKLKDLSWSLNIKDRASAGVVDPERPGLRI